MRCVVFFLLIFCITCSIVYAQESSDVPQQRIDHYIDIITLTNGEVIKGTITEEVNRSYIWIKKEDGMKVKIDYSGILGRSQEPVYVEIKRNIHDPSTMITLQEYEHLKKSRTLAAMLDIIPFLAAGHLYAGKWLRGMLFEVGYFVSAVWFLGEALKGYDPGGGSGGGHNDGGAAILFVTTIGIHVWKIFDASHCVRTYNERLMKRVRQDSETPKLEVGLLMNYRNNNTELGFTLRF